MKSRTLAVCALFVATTAVLAQLSIPLPFSAVPLTGQTFSVFLAGGMLNGRLASACMAAYVFLGAVGLPVFAQGRAGPSVLAGPSGGYLFGFIIGAYLCGTLLEKKPRPTRRHLALGMAACLVAYYVFGAGHMALVLGLGPRQAILLGVLPFLPLDAFKLLLATAVASPLRRALDLGRRT